MVEGQGPAPNLAHRIISLKWHSPLRKGAACGLGSAGQEGRARRRGGQEGNWELPPPRCVHRPPVLFAAPGPWHMLRAPSPPCSFLSNLSEASGLNLSLPQSRLPGLPCPRPCPPVVRSCSLVCWPSSDTSTFWAGTVCCPERPPHTAGTSSVQEPAVALPPLQAASWVHLGALGGPMTEDWCPCSQKKVSLASAKPLIPDASWTKPGWKHTQREPRGAEKAWPVSFLLSFI